MAFSIEMLAFVDSTQRRTRIHVTSFDHMAEVADFLGRFNDDELQPGEELRVYATESDA